MLVSAIPSSYPKKIGPTSWNTFNPTSGGRRSYNGTFPQFTDTPGWTWANGGPLAALVAAGYALGVQISCDRLESNSGSTHTYRVWINGVYPTGLQSVDTSGAANPRLSGYIAIGTAAGAMTFKDGIDHSETGFVGNVLITYQYTRT